MLNGVQHTIIGVTPEGFHGTFVGYSFNFWVPVSMQERFDPGGYKLEDRGADWIEGFAKLKPGVTREQAQAEISAVARRLESAYPATNRGHAIQLYPLWQTPFNNAGTLFPTLRIALVVVCLVLLIACANVGNLLLVRSFARRREMTGRLSIGAGRLRLLRQLLTTEHQRREQLGPCASSRQDRSGGSPEVRVGKRGRRTWKSMGAVEPCPGPSIHELRLVGRRGAPAEESAGNPNCQPRLLDPECRNDRCRFSLGRIRCAPHEAVSGPSN